MSKGKRGKQGGTEVRFTGLVALPHGCASVILSGGEVVSVEWERKKELVGKTIAKKYPGAEKIAVENSVPGKILHAYSRGRILSPRDISTLPVAWESLPDFQRKVLRATAGIPYGKTVTYGELATAVGSPGAARAVGAALARNPWPVLVPCHRVVGKGGRLVGFGKGLAAKEALLRFEKENVGRVGVAQ
jgi:methylated-DNA-[protein]-cysteine S-methyltransferase